MSENSGSAPRPVPQATAETRSRRAFIIRPFGTKSGIDFEKVDADLISEALKYLGIEGRTTMEILRTGNIRTDMFQLLLVADVVIADISIHNANVFYELGVRHALRRAATVMIRGREGGDKVPFDLFTDRYFAYDEKTPTSSVDGLVRVLYDSIHLSESDSPIFRLLPQMGEQEPESFLAVPPACAEAIKRAEKEEMRGDLALLSEEISGMPWTRVALREVGRAQFELGAMEAAKDTWEAVRRFDEDDVEANTLLGTIYQKLGGLADSDIAIDRVLARRDLSRKARAEALALKGRNAKSLWTKEWRDGADRTRARTTALASGWLRKSFELYSEGFRTDLTNFFPGVNAVSLLVILIQLAEADLSTWRNSFKNDRKGDEELDKLKTRLAELLVTVGASIQAEQDLAKAAGKSDLWADISEADMSLYCGASAARVRAHYDLVRGISPFKVGAVRGQLEIFERLGVYEDQARAALETLPQAKADPAPPHVLLFTGHRVDDPGRKTPRFPPDKVDVARQEIGAAIDKAITAHGRTMIGISGAASGGDILFQEECRSRGIPTTIYLALPQNEYAVASVSSAGSEWTRKFYGLLKSIPSRVLQPSKDLPKWLAHRTGYSVWQRNNLWMLHNALANGSSRVTLIALWNGQAGDGPGGTADMVDQIQKRGGEVAFVGRGTVFPK